MAEHKAEIDAIINNAEAPSFDNTIVAMERTGTLLTKVSGVFYNLTSAHTNEEMQALSKTLAPLLSTHSDDINLMNNCFNGSNRCTTSATH